MEAEQRGVLWHGLLLVPTYVERIVRGVINPAYTVEAVRDSDAMMLLASTGQDSCRQPQSLRSKIVWRYGGKLQPLPSSPTGL